MKEFISLLDAAFSLFIKFRDAQKPKEATCSHLLLLAHNDVPNVEHKDAAYCVCKPRYQCFQCHQIFDPRNGFYSRLR